MKNFTVLLKNVLLATIKALSAFQDLFITVKLLVPMNPHRNIVVTLSNLRGKVCKFPIALERAKFASTKIYYTVTLKKFRFKKSKNKAT